MSEHCCSLSVGEKVPDFELEMFDPFRCDFGKIGLKKLGSIGGHFSKLDNDEYVQTKMSKVEK